MQPVVDAIPQAVRGVLRIAGDAVSADACLAVAPQIAIGVLTQPEVRRFGDEHPALDEGERSRHHQAIEEHRGSVGPAVGVRIFEHDDAADWIAFATPLQVAHVALVLDHPDAAVRIEFEEDRAVDHRLGSDELDAIAGSEPERLQGRVGIERRCRRDLDAREESVRAFPVRPAGELRWRPRTRPLLRGRSGLSDLLGGSDGQCGREHGQQCQVMATHRAGLRQDDRRLA